MEIWIGRDGERHGPYKEEDVREWLRSGQLSRDDLAWREGLADWQPLSALFPDVAASAPPPPPLGQRTLSAATTAMLEDYAGFWKRLVAYILDAILLYIPSVLIEKMFNGDVAKLALERAVAASAGNPELVLAAQQQYYAAMWPALLIGALIAWAYFAVCESSSWQGTIGKLALGIRVTDLHGARISLARAIGRYPGKFLSAFILCIGFLMVAWTQRKQGLHDMLAGTLVLNGRASEYSSGTRPPADRNGSFSA